MFEACQQGNVNSQYTPFSGFSVGCCIKKLCYQLEFGK